MRSECRKYNNKLEGLMNENVVNIIMKLNECVISLKSFINKKI